ncbi:hypothetical protein ASPU41_03260 [Arthrobacter sp. U41]|nr:hypothetical protein ASPU41_03260 [Arthrobacter sp. U41]
MKHRVTWGVAAAIALSLTSCAATPQSDPTNGPASPPAQQELPTELLLSIGGKKAVMHSGPSSAPRVEAQLTGSLASDGAGCITARAKDGETTTLVFPEGTNFNGESLVLPDGSALSDGNSVALEGARVPANESLSTCHRWRRLKT